MPRRSLLPIAAWAAMATAAAVAQTKAPAASDPFTGTWVLVPERSHFYRGTPPRNEVAIFSDDGTTERLRAILLTPDGKVSVSEYRLTLGGKAAPIRDIGGGGTIGTATVVRTGPTSELKTGIGRDGKPATTIHRTISADGRFLTSRITSADGEQLSDRVFVRRSP